MTTLATLTQPFTRVTPRGVTIVTSGVATEQRCALAIGNFDGVHKGHQALLQTTIALAKTHALLPATLTFHPHPAAFLRGAAPPTVVPTWRREALLREQGIEVVHIAQFNAALAGLEPRAFVEDVLVAALGTRLVVVGEDFRFGAKRAGDLRMLEALGRDLGLIVHVASMVHTEDPALGDSAKISSSQIRTLVTSGKISEATTLLGRPPVLSGEVVHGHARGRVLGFPTANFVPEEVLPPHGVYAVTLHVRTNEGLRRLGGGVMNLGVRPTIASSLALSAEAHVFDVEEDLYGKTVLVEIHALIRAEKKFDSLDALKAQIALDATEARRILASLASQA
jgi:riboflavin kinase / FMN adenylyltransferase